MQHASGLFCALLLCLLSTPAARAQADRPETARRPNIVFIMSDDHAWQAISAYGSDRNSTPNIDRLAREGHLQTARPCALAHVGPPAPTPDEAPYPGDAPVHAVVHCRHALGEAPVDLAFPRAKALAALRLERAQVIPVALHAPRGGEGGVPIALYAGP